MEGGSIKLFRKGGGEQNKGAPNFVRQALFKHLFICFTFEQGRSKGREAAFTASFFNSSINIGVVCVKISTLNHRIFGSCCLQLIER